MFKPRRLLLGTHNKGKAKEISALLAALPFEVQTLDDFPGLIVPEETGTTLEENAILKARHYAESTGLLTLADDTGLEVDALNGAPGVYCSTYAGAGCSYADNNLKLIRELHEVPLPKRNAVFRTVIACFDPITQHLELAQGKLSGFIASTINGDAGFGYDPVFYIPELGRTLSELTLSQKNLISHRAQALLQAKNILMRCL